MWSKGKQKTILKCKHIMTLKNSFLSSRKTPLRWNYNHQNSSINYLSYFNFIPIERFITDYVQCYSKKYTRSRL